MTEKLEVAKLATELTIALLGDGQRRDTEIERAARQAGAGKETPAALVLFDAIYDHLLAKLTP